MLTSVTFQHIVIGQAGNADSVQCYVISCFIIIRFFIIIININQIYTLMKFVGQMNAILPFILLSTHLFVEHTFRMHESVITFDDF